VCNDPGAVGFGGGGGVEPGATVPGAGGRRAIRRGSIGGAPRLTFFFTRSPSVPVGAGASATTATGTSTGAAFTTGFAAALGAAFAAGFAAALGAALGAAFAGALGAGFAGALGAAFAAGFAGAFAAGFTGAAGFFGAAFAPVVATLPVAVLDGRTFDGLCRAVAPPEPFVALAFVIGSPRIDRVAAVRSI